MAAAAGALPQQLQGLKGALAEGLIVFIARATLFKIVSCPVSCWISSELKNSFVSAETCLC